MSDSQSETNRRSKSNERQPNEPGDKKSINTEKYESQDTHLTRHRSNRTHTLGLGWKYLLGVRVEGEALWEVEVN